MPTTFLPEKSNRLAERYVFHFECPCGAEGELTVTECTQDRASPFDCPEVCGRVYVMWLQDRTPAIRCVVSVQFEKG